ncbi:hypothetical protein ACFFHH_17325 [Cytobacillus solani]|nr:hypothetical protein [Cytobacillus solani]
MSKKNRKKRSATENVEFSNELGDMNASKMYEIPFMNEEKKKKK